MAKTNKIKKLINNGSVTNFSDISHILNIENGNIYLSGTIEEYNVKSIREDLNLIQWSGRSDATIYMTSPGGSVHAALGIYDIIKQCPLKIKVVVSGFAASAACSIVLQAAEKRIGFENSRYLLHEISQFEFGNSTASDKKDSLKEIETLTNIMYKILMDRTGRSLKEIQDVIERRQTWMSAQEALEFGLIDKIEE